MAGAYYRRQELTCSISRSVTSLVNDYREGAIKTRTSVTANLDSLAPDCVTSMRLINTSLQ